MAKVLVTLVAFITTLCITLTVLFHRWVYFHWAMLRGDYGLLEASYPTTTLSFYKALLKSVGGFDNYLLVSASLAVSCWLAVAFLVFWLHRKFKRILQRYDDLYSQVQENKTILKEEVKTEKFPWQPPVE